MESIIEAATEASKKEIGEALNTANNQAINDLTTEYESILKCLSKTNTTQSELENETKN